MALSWQLAIFYGIGMALFAYVGWSILPLLPGRFVAYRLVILPLLGLSAMSIGLSMLNVFGLSVSRGLVLLLVLCGLANAYHLYSLRRGGIRPPRYDEPWPVLWLVSVGLYVLTVSPILSYGYVAPIAAGWDFEFYWPIAEYLKTHSVRDSIAGPPNPLWVVMNNPAVRGMGWGFSFVDAALGVLLGKDSSWTFTPLVGLVYSLLPLSVYVFARTVGALGRWASLVVAVLAGLNSLLLWTPYFNLGAHTLFLVISPLTIVSMDQVLRERNWRSIGFGAVGLAAMLVAYLPGALLFALPLAALGASYLLGSSQRLKIVGVGAAVIAFSVLPGLFGWQRALEQGRQVSRSRPPGPGVVRFLPISDWVGMTPFDHNMNPGGWIKLYGSALNSTLVPTAKVLTVPVLAFSAVGIIGAVVSRNWPLLATAGPLLIYTLSLRFVERYPYGYLKAASCGLFVLLCLAALGFSRAWEACRTIRPRMLYRMARVSLATGALAVVGLASYNGYVATARYYGPDSLYYRAAHSELPRVKRLIPSGASVYVSGDERLGVPTTTLLSHLLLGRELRGRYRTGYSRLDNLEPGRIYDYAILHANENPERLGYGAGRLLWRNGLVGIYERGSMPSTHVDMAQAGTVAAFSRGSKVGIDVDAATVRIGNTQISLPPVLRGMTRGQVALGLVAKREQGIAIDTGQGTEHLVPRGAVTVYRSRPLALPARVVIGTDSASRGYLLWVDLAPEGAFPPGLKHHADLGFVRASSTLGRKEISTSLQFFLGGRGTAQLSLDIWGKHPTDGRDIHYGYWVLGPQTEGGDIQVRVDPIAQKAAFTQDRVPIQAGGERFGLRDGSYSAALWFYDKGRIVQTFKLYEFAVTGEKASAFRLAKPEPFGVIAFQ